MCYDNPTKDHFVSKNAQRFLKCKELTSLLVIHVILFHENHSITQEK